MTEPSPQPESLDVAPASAAPAGEPTAPAAADAASLPPHSESPSAPGDAPPSPSPPKTAPDVPDSGGAGVKADVWSEFAEKVKAKVKEFPVLEYDPETDPELLEAKRKAEEATDEGSGEPSEPPEASRSVMPITPRSTRTPRKTEDRPPGELDNSGIAPEAAFYRFAGKRIQEGLDFRPRLDVVIQQLEEQSRFEVGSSYWPRETPIERLQRLRKEVPETIAAVKEYLASLDKLKKTVDSGDGTLASEVFKDCEVLRGAIQQTDAHVKVLATHDPLFRREFYGSNSAGGKKALHDLCGSEAGPMRVLMSKLAAVQNHAERTRQVFLSGEEPVPSASSVPVGAQAEKGKEEEGEGATEEEKKRHRESRAEALKNLGRGVVYQLPSGDGHLSAARDDRLERVERMEKRVNALLNMIGKSKAALPKAAATAGQAEEGAAGGEEKKPKAQPAPAPISLSTQLTDLYARLQRCGSEGAIRRAEMSIRALQCELEQIRPRPVGGPDADDSDIPDAFNPNTRLQKLYDDVVIYDDTAKQMKQMLHSLKDCEKEYLQAVHVVQTIRAQEVQQFALLDLVHASKDGMETLEKQIKENDAVLKKNADILVKRLSK
uniref:Uncharacterized protein n=1 Tax=Chromera velia CCMP2878 TaxID=1169474 RepID=A0A0G4FG83_9ALVE|eukprot:Cvel_16792.t1-p1 / transcript=Cvel_16792.t1 / gene=Cvel_16792 / organism=Chromera_velia_CCMP2878 / gene_product=hypothetical protein / transcript_product=hypothetical protein / location=Cvel_scaffold1311:6706-15192(+) / protein_length=604 / sequence_SO=supercontig / SO=protein_coding / is_pseudo=false